MKFVPAVVALGLALWSAPGVARDVEDGHVLVVGTRANPPFVVHKADGSWSGATIELWRGVAEELGLRFELTERDLDGLTRGLEDGSLDLVAAALTVTDERERRFDFTHPYHTSGLGIAIAHDVGENYFDLFWLVLNESFFRLIVIFASMQLLIGALMWWLERGRNPHFGGSAAAGVGAGLWWAVVTMATVGYGDKVPVTPAGRLLAMFWMLASLIILTTMTASITTSLTIGRLEARIDSPDDLGKLRLGAVTFSTGAGYLGDAGLEARHYPDPQAALAAIAADEIDAVVHDAPILKALIAASYPERIDLLPRTFRRQDYAFAVPTGSPLREPINQILARKVAFEDL